MTLSTLNKLATAALFFTTTILVASSTSTPLGYRGTERVNPGETVAFRASGRVEREAVAYRATGRVDVVATYRASEQGLG